MVRVVRATKETRLRDRKRNRLLLCIGKYRFHLSGAESRKLMEDLRRRA